MLATPYPATNGDLATALRGAETVTPGGVREGEQLAEQTRTERRRLQTRGALLEAGHALLGEQGVSEWPISDLADRADVALGSFYNHFTDRDEFVEELVKYYVLDRQENLLARHIPDDNFVVRMAYRFTFLVDLALDEAPHRRFVVAAGLGGFLYRPAMNSLFLQRLEAAREAGDLKAIDLQYALSSLRGLSLSLFRHIDLVADTDPESLDRETLRTETVRMAFAIVDAPESTVDGILRTIRELPPLDGEELSTP